MRLLKAVSLIARLVFPAVAQIQYGSTVLANVSAPVNSSNSYIVELSDVRLCILDEALVQLMFKVLIAFLQANIQGTFLNAARSRGGIFSNANIHLTKNFTSDIFNGASITTAELSASDIAQIPGVVNVWPNRKLFLPPRPGSKRFPHFPFPTPSTTSNYSVHGLTDVDKVQTLGIKGNGVVVGIVDTGIWYPHPAVSDSKKVLECFINR